MTALIERGLRREVDEPEAAPKIRTPLPVSSRRGGLLPGVDLDDGSRLLELDDVESLRRSL